MIKNIIYSIINCMLWCVPLLSFAQTITPEPARDWFLQYPSDDKVEGIGIEKAYHDFLSKEPSQPVTVAVIDTGIDIDHEDLKGQIWVNEDEIADNGIDDDRNGYVDDIHGWNFIGNIEQDGTELMREYIKLKKYVSKKGEDKVRRKDLLYYLSLKEQFEKQKQENETRLAQYQDIYQEILQCKSMVQDKLDTTDLTVTLLAQTNFDNPTLQRAKTYLQDILESIQEQHVDTFVQQLEGAIKEMENVLQYGYNTNFDPRHILKDDYQNSKEKIYGNNNVKGKGDMAHGTHVAGIIGANRTNGIGIKGIAKNIRIMPIRVVPSAGDERDKDVANAIRYAVDNGAQIINMSFGKSLSPEKKVVDRAIRHAEKKGVLVIHAAGNSNKNIDDKDNFPSRYYNSKKAMKNWIEVGASTPWATTELLANFSNYGLQTVDIFAPGVSIYSTLPHNKYGAFQGTSQAAPVVAGTAAVLLSYFPSMTATQVADIIRQSARQYPDLEINIPGSEEKTTLKKLCRTAGLLDAYAAIKMARHKYPINSSE